MLETKQLYRHLICDGYTIKCRQNINENYGYCLYNGSSPVAQIHNSQFKKIAHLLKKKKGVFSLNLNTVRQQNGHANVKKIYKQNKYQWKVQV